MGNTILLRTALIVLIAAPVGARPFDVAQGGRGQNPNQQQAAQPGGRESAGPVEEKTSRTPHTITLDGREIKYSATTGTLPIRGDDGKVRPHDVHAAVGTQGAQERHREVHRRDTQRQAQRRAALTRKSISTEEERAARGTP
jgi:hypothetical protein